MVFERSIVEPFSCQTKPLLAIVTGSFLFENAREYMISKIINPIELTIMNINKMIHKDFILSIYSLRICWPISNKKRYLFAHVNIMLLLFNIGLFAQSKDVSEKFNQQLNGQEITGRGSVKVEQGVLKSKVAYVSFGDISMENYEFSFRARTAEKEKEVQIWAGFRASGRNDRYILGLRGGIQNDL